MSRESSPIRSEGTGETLKKGALVAALTALGAAIGTTVEGAVIGSTVDATLGGSTLGMGTLIGGLSGLTIGLLTYARRRHVIRVEGGDRPIRTVNINRNFHYPMVRGPEPRPSNEARG